MPYLPWVPGAGGGVPGGGGQGDLRRHQPRRDRPAGQEEVGAGPGAGAGVGPGVGAVAGAGAGPGAGAGAGAGNILKWDRNKYNLL